jgi:hypothetical protein
MQGATECLIACAATALPAGTLAILNNRFLAVVLRMPEGRADFRRMLRRFRRA